MRTEIHGGNIHKYDHKVTDFSANLNPLGMPQSVKNAVVKNIAEYECYPDPDSTEIREAISKHYSVGFYSVCCGNGADDIIYRIAGSFKPQKAVLFAPSFYDYSSALELAGTEISRIFLRDEDGFYMDDSVFDSIKEMRPDMVFVCNPNNPTGIAESSAKILKLAEVCRIIGARLIVDECFSDFLEHEEYFSIIDSIESLKNVIILKSFTKMYAMAGLRLGFAICGDPKDAELLANSTQSWPISTPAAKAGVAALKDKEFLEATSRYVHREREYLMSEFEKLGIKTYDSRANYIFFRSVSGLETILQKRDILIRSCSNYIGLDDTYYRIAVRTREENELLVNSLKEIFSGQEKADG